MPFLQRMLRTPTYSNTGSVARDHLALERTFLAWLRTGLGFIALGIAVERFNQLDLPALLREIKGAQGPRVVDDSASVSGAKQHAHERLLVGSLLGLGSASIGYGVLRHFSTMKMLERGLFKPAYYGAAGLGIAVTGLAGASFANMLSRHSNQDETAKRSSR